MRRLGSGKNETPIGLSLGTELVNCKSEMISSNQYFLNWRNENFDLFCQDLNKSNDDDEFDASYWRRYYRLHYKAAIEYMKRRGKIIKYGE